MATLFEAERQRLGRRIKQARKDAGLSHDALGARVGTSRQHLIKLEKGIHAPGPVMLSAIAEATGKPESFFRAAEDDEDEEADLPTVLQQLAAVIAREVENAVRASRASEATA